MITQLNLPQGSSLPQIQGSAMFNSPVGAVIFVSSLTGSDTKSRLKYFGAGTSQSQGSTQGPIGDPQYPLATVFGTNGALSYCKAARGDMIVVLPGHVENLSTNGSYPVAAGVNITGLGSRTARPAFTFTGGTATVITLAAGASIENCFFVLSGVAGVVKGFNVTGAGAALLNCRINMASVTNQATNAITVGAADFIVSNSEIDALAAAGSANAIISSAAVANFKLLGCDIRGDFSTACLVTAAALHLTNIMIDNCILYQVNATAKVVINFTTSTTGIIRNSTFVGKGWATAAGAITGASSILLRWFQNYGMDETATAVSGILVPAAGAIT